MGTVDAKNRVNFYDGMIRVVDPGRPGDPQVPVPRVHAAHRRAGGALDLPQVPLPQEGRLEGLRRRQGQRRLLRDAAVAAERLRRHGHPPGAGALRQVLPHLRLEAKITAATQPVHHRLATHWARLIELLYAAERMLELAQDPEITSA